MNEFSGYPEVVETRTSQGTTKWTIVSGLIAKRDVVEEDKSDQDALYIGQTTIGSRSQNDDSEEVAIKSDDVPVYRNGEDGPLGVPTGLVFIRFQQGTIMNAHRDILENIGFEIYKVSASDSAGWVRQKSGSYGDALTLSTALQELPGIEVVEPQFTMQRHSKVQPDPSRRL